jgi:hypothetical protein
MFPREPQHGLQLVSIMSAAFQKMVPGTDVAIDLSREYAQADAMLGTKYPPCPQTPPFQNSGSVA